MKRVEICLSGVVQGVGFRYFTKKMAKEFGIYGYAMNLQNGRVFIVAEGGNEQLEKFISTIKQGPSYAIVKNIDIVERPATNEFSDFTIKY